MKTPSGVNNGNSKAVWAVLFILGAVLFTGAAFPQFPIQPLLVPADLRITVPRPIMGIAKVPVRSSRSLERLERMLFTERIVAVSA